MGCDLVPDGCPEWCRSQSSEAYGSFFIAGGSHLPLIASELGE